MYSTGVQMNPNPAIMSAEQMQHVVQAAQQKKARGSTEENDPEYAKLLSILRYYQSINRPQPVGGLSQQQLNQLRYQTQSYKHLASGEQIPSLLQQSVLGLTEQQQPQNVAAKVVDATLKTTIPAIQSQTTQRYITPSLMPVVHPSVDPNHLKSARQEYLKARVDLRIKELSSMPAESLSGGEKMKALIELKSLQLLEKQQKLRREILDSVSKSSTLATALDRSSFRRMKKQSLREARQTEKQERALRGEKDKRERQKHLDYINSILAHGRDFMTHHRTVQARHQKLGAAVLRFHAAAMREEEVRKSRHSQERLKALKSNDEEAYLRLLDKTKDTRITTILEQTNSFLTKLTNAVETQKTSVDMQIDTSTITKTTNANGDVEEDDPDMPRDYYSTAHRIQEIVTEQSSLLVGGTLKEYQIKGLQWMVSLYNNRLNGILADEMGLGKTIQTLSLITYLIEKKKQPGPFLVIVPLSTMTNWVLEFDKWAPSVTKIVYKGSPDTRKNLSMQVRQGNFNVLLTTFEYIINPKDRPTLSKIKWVHMIIDEGHRLKNSGSRLSVTLMQHYTSRYRLILTGTPLQNNLPELWALLNFILPKIFNSVKSFDEWFNSPFTSSSINEKIELNEEEQLLIIRRLHKVLRPFLLRRLKKDVESELPDKVEIVIKCPMSALQKRLTDQIKSRKYNIEGFANKPKKALSNLVMQFRKICNHPYVFTEVEDTLNPQHITDRNLFRVAGKFELLDRILPKFKVKDHRVLMFFQMTAIMDIMEDYLRWKGFTYLRLDGNTKADDRTVMLKKFNSKEEPPFIFLLSTRAGGLGLNLQTADTVIIYDSDWNPHQDLQAQDRAHRIGQKKEVRILRLITAKSVEESILARAQYKLDIDGKVIQAGKFDNKTTDREREELLRSLFGAEEEDEEDLEGVDDQDKKVSKEGEWMGDAELNEIIARNEEELELYNKMDAERRALEKQQHEDYGNAGPVPHRLMQDNELPEVFLVDVNIPDEPKIELPTGRGARNRKDIQYQIPNEEEFDEVIDDAVDVSSFLKREEARIAETKAKKERKAENHRKRRAAGEEVDSDADAYEDVPDDPMELPDPDGTADVVNTTSKRTNEEDSPSTKKKKKAKKPFAGVDPDMPETLDAATRQTLTTIFNACYKAVEELEVEEEDYVRRRSELFLELPDRNAYADYYKVIVNPIAMDMIAHRINSPYYTSLQAFAQDFATMFKNAMTYNVEGSEVYQDALHMQEVFNQTLQRHTKPVQQPAQPQQYPPQQFPVPSQQQYPVHNQHPGQPQYQQYYPGQQFSQQQQSSQFPGQQKSQFSGQQYSQPTHPQQYPQNPNGFPQ